MLTPPDHLHNGCVRSSHCVRYIYEKKKKCVKPWMQWVWRRLAVVSSSKWPLLRSQVGLPPPHRTPYPPTPTPSRVALRARGFKGGGEVFSRVSQCPISRAKKVYGLVLPHFINKAPSHVLRGLCWNFFMILSKFIIKVAAYWYN